MVEVIVSIITGVLTLIGVCVTAMAGSRKTRSDIMTQLERSQAISDERLSELTREVREHNNFARRMPVVEEQIKVINHRIQDLEQEGK